MSSKGIKNGMLAHINWVSTSEARGELSSHLDTANQGERMVLATKGKGPRACLVSLKDGAMLQLLDEHPEIKAQMQGFFEEKERSFAGG